MQDNAPGFLGSFELGPNDTEEAGIYVGDAYELGQEVPRESVDLIFCDPVWDNLWQYAWLSSFAGRVLRPGKSVLAQVGNLFRPRVEKVIAASIAEGTDLALRMLLYERLTGGHSLLRGPRAIAFLKPYLWYAKSGPRQDGWIPQLVTGGGRRKGTHVWGDSTQAAETWISRFTDPNDIVVDPFSGSGMVPIACIRTGRRYVAFEIDPEHVEHARTACGFAQHCMIPSGRQLEIAL